MLGSQNSNISDLLSVCQELLLSCERIVCCLLVLVWFQIFEVLPEVYLTNEGAM